MQHGLVRYEAGSVGLYEFNLTRLLAMLHYPKYIAAVKVRGSQGQLQLLKHERALVSNPDPNLRVTTIVQPILLGCAIVVMRRLGSGFETKGAPSSLWLPSQVNPSWLWPSLLITSLGLHVLECRE